MHLDWRDVKKGLRTASGTSPDMSRRPLVARDLQCGGTWQSPPPEDAKACVPGPQQALFRGSNCPGHAPRIASRRPRANHSGVTPGPQGIHMTQNLYYSVINLRSFFCTASEPSIVALRAHSGLWRDGGSSDVSLLVETCGFIVCPDEVRNAE